jgi:hypothetical protein
LGETKVSGRRVTCKAPLAHLEEGSGRSKTSPTAILQCTHSLEDEFYELAFQGSQNGSQDHRDARQRGAFPYPKAHFASYCGTAPVEASSGEVVRHTGSRWPATASSTTPYTWSQYARPGRTLGAEGTTARRWRRANLVRRRCGASRGASQMPSSGASWRLRRRLLAAPLDKEEPRNRERRSSKYFPSTRLDE